MRACSRRTVLAGLSTMIAAPAIAGNKQHSPVAHGVLANNRIAKEFQPLNLNLPYVTLWGPNGKRSITEFKGRTILMPLWAEWCAPCMSEMPDFARLQSQYGNDKFAIIPVLSATRHKLPPDKLGPIMKLMNCAVFEPLVEEEFGEKLAQTFGRNGRSFALPCNVLIAPSGKAVARETGAVPSDSGTPAKTYNETLTRVQDGVIQSAWGQAPGEEFAKAMSEGFVI